jgi:lipopolysaccharide transport system ATP-binding protein
MSIVHSPKRVFSMNDIAIRAEELSKKYYIGKKQESYKTLRDTLADSFVAPFRKAGKLLRGHATGAAGLDETIWALKDVSFEIKKGEVLGIIGRNGAGKSTLLKVLSRITEPTTGYAEIHGRIGSLLEVGTGFHPELTGRENIYLNGAILGMKKTEIDEKFDEIVAFAEVEKFIDTPVKHYSSGMYLRLAFAVAAHLETEIILVDEVLAVGDARFQKKCMNKMQDVGQKGRTVLFVSHNMSAVTRLCERVILLEEGSITRDGLSHDVVGAYLNSGGTAAHREWTEKDAPGGEIARLRGVKVVTEEGEVTDTLDIRRSVAIEIEYDILKSGYVLLPNFDLYNEEGVHVFKALDQDPHWRGRRRPQGRYSSTAWIPGNFLSEGRFFVAANLVTLEPIIKQCRELDVVSFQVIDNFNGDSVRGSYGGHIPGAVRPYLRWETKFNQDISVSDRFFNNEYKTNYLTSKTENEN